MGRESGFRGIGRGYERQAGEDEQEWDHRGRAPGRWIRPSEVKLSSIRRRRNDFVLSRLIAFSYQWADMELRHLRYFVAVAEELNFRKAADRLRVAQPALSTQIRDLEHDVGTRLLDRNTGGVRLTDAGAAFLAEAQAVLARAREAVGVAREAAQGRRGRLTVAYFSPFVMGFVPASMKVFRDRFPEVEVVLVEMAPPSHVAALEAGEIHVGFRVMGGAPLPPGLKSAPIARARICAVMARTHRLARSPRVSLAALAEEPVLYLEIRPSLAYMHGEMIRRIFAGRGLKLGKLRAIDGSESFRATLESGLGVSLITEIGGLANSQALVTRPLKETGPDLVIELQAVWRADRDSPLTANFISVLQETAVPRKKSQRDRVTT